MSKKAKKGEKSFQGLSCSAIKMIAMVSMLLDHTAAICLEGYVTAHQSTDVFFVLYICMRAIGRLAFPLFCFCMVEGFFHTSARVRYAIRLGGFMLLSEIPFDLAFSGKLLEFGYQNVIVTLFIGYLTIWGLDSVRRRYKKSIGQQILIVTAGCVVAYLGHTDYSMVGIWAIVALYYIHQTPVSSMFYACILLLASSYLEAIAFFDMLVVKFYDKRKGRNTKWFFYIFYPAHLLVLYFIQKMLPPL